MFCTEGMKRSFAAYPEFLCLDATYKLLNIRAPVYLILNEDGNGESVVVCIGILVQEDASSLEWFLESFKSQNPFWNKIKTVMTDKDLTERDAILKAFPDVSLQLCIFHVLKIFNTEITCDKYKITSSEKNSIMDFLQKIVYSKSETEFKTLVDNMKALIPNRVFTYIEESWLSIKDQWCPYLARIPSNFLNTTNNRLECINSKLKKVISKNSTLEEFVDKLFTILTLLKEEQNFRLADHLNRRYTGVAYTDLQFKYKKLISPYAFDKMSNQFCYTSVQIDEAAEEGVFYCYSKSKDNDNTVKYKTRADCCECYFYVSINLPCKHIFAVRTYLNMDAYEPTIVADRWKLNYVVKHSNLFAQDESHEIDENLTKDLVSVAVKNRPKVLSQQEKFRILFVKCKLMASLGAEAQSQDFSKICLLFDDIILNLQKCRYNLSLADYHEPYILNMNNNAVAEDIEATTTENQIYNHPLECTENIGNICEEIAEDHRYTSVFPNQHYLYTESNNFTEMNKDPPEHRVVIESTTLVDHKQVDSAVVQDSIETSNQDMYCETEMEEAVAESAQYTNVSQNKQQLDKKNDKFIENQDPSEHIVVTESANSVNNNQIDSVAERSSQYLHGDEAMDEMVGECSQPNVSAKIDLAKIKIFPAKPRGRPKGYDKTVIGLIKKKAPRNMLFDKKQKNEKKNMILSWILKDTTNLKNLTSSLDNIKPHDEIDIRLLEVNLSLVKSYFAPELWPSIKKIKQELTRKAKWICMECKQDIFRSQPSVRCDSCLHWVHVVHLGKNALDAKYYFCNNCTK